MNCPYCENEMEKGKISLTTVQGLVQIVLSYTSEEEAKKSFFARQSKDKMILSGAKIEAYCCPNCKKIMPIFDI
ncbi:MAG: PF20097 family protein [Ruminococcus flavefaciens]|nr:PF20097 family protein [Ruminococcus flavefaciens]MCM1228672.1 PF20097 family protein [Ruminococcus flavefaciens]